MTERVLVFPEDVVVGSLAVHHRDAWLPRVPARGNVSVPLDGVVHLASATPVRGLGCLQADDLYSLSPQKKSATDTDMLSLEGTDVDDAVVPHLAAMQSLKTIALWGARMSTRGMAALQEALPAAIISSYDTGHRLARERSRDAILRILARRMGVESRVPAEDALSRLLPPGSAIDWCLQGRSRRLWTHTDGFDTLALRLGAYFDFDLLVLTPDGRQRRIPWLRRRRSGRRANDARRGGDAALSRQC